MGEDQSSQIASALAKLSLEVAAGRANKAGLEDVALKALRNVGFAPDFAVEPNLMGVLEHALDLLKRDLVATHIDGPVRVVIEDRVYPPRAFVDFRGQYGSGPGISPIESEDNRSALLAAAEDTADVSRRTSHPVRHSDSSNI